MVKYSQDQALKIKVSKLFYQKSLSILAISKKLKISRFIIKNLINKALEDGTVKIIIDEPEGFFFELEDALEEKFKIYRAFVVATGISYEETRKNIGKAAARGLVEMVSDNDCIGIAWGTTIYEMLNALPRQVNKKGIKIVQITGGLSQVSVSYDSIQITRKLAEIFNAKSNQLYAPAIFDNLETKKLMLSESKIKETLDMFREINFAITGIGSIFPEPSTILYKKGFIKKEELMEIQKCDPVGNINSYFFNKDGQECPSPINDRTLDMDINNLKRIRYVLGLAGGIIKVEAIRAALKGKIINIIVTDEETAKELITE